MNTQVKPKVTSLFKSMMNSSDMVLNFDPSTDNMVYDHIQERKFFYGNFERIHKTQPLNFECRMEFRVKQLSIGLMNDVVFHYMTVNEQSLALTIIDLDAVLKTNLSADVVLVQAKSYICPVTKRRLADLIASGEINPNKFNLKYEYLVNNFEIEYYA